MSAANWKVGDKILCVDAINNRRETGLTSGLKAGEEYTIYETHRDCGNPVWLSVGIQGPVRKCTICGMLSYTRYHYAWRFIKLDPDFKLETEEAYTPMCIPETNIIIHQGNTK